MFYFSLLLLLFEQNREYNTFHDFQSGSEPLPVPSVLPRFGSAPRLAERQQDAKQCNSADHLQLECDKEPLLTWKTEYYCGCMWQDVELYPGRLRLTTSDLFCCPMHSVTMIDARDVGGITTERSLKWYHLTLVTVFLILIVGSVTGLLEVMVDDCSNLPACNNSDAQITAVEVFLSICFFVMIFICVFCCVPNPHVIKFDVTRAFGGGVWFGGVISVQGEQSPSEIYLKLRDTR